MYKLEMCDCLRGSTRLRQTNVRGKPERNQLKADLNKVRVEVEHARLIDHEIKPKRRRRLFRVIIVFFRSFGLFQCCGFFFLLATAAITVAVDTLRRSVT